MGHKLQGRPHLLSQYRNLHSEHLALDPHTPPLPARGENQNDCELSPILTPSHAGLMFEQNIFSFICSVKQTDE